jgi:natural product biosynthesis luciferase-like monooxygenase protein
MKFSLFVLPCWRPGISPTLARFYDELIEMVVLADRTGWDRVWLSEHHFHYYGGASPNPAILLTAFARATRAIRLGSGVSLLPLHNPLRIAEDFGMVDQLSGGRLDFGIGRGYLPHEFEGLGVAQAEATMRFQAAFDLIRRAWTGADPGLEVHPRPHQAQPPVWVACSRTRESFEWAGERGLGLMMNQYPMSRAEARTRFGWYKDAYAGAGHDAAQRRAKMSLFLHIAPTEERAIAEAKAAVQEHANLFRLLITGDRWNRNYEGDESVFEFIAPGGDVRAALRERTLIGTPEQIIERIAHYRAEGFDELSLVVRYGTLPHAAALANIERFNAEIRPHFRARAAA